MGSSYRILERGPTSPTDSRPCHEGEREVEIELHESSGRFYLCVNNDESLGPRLTTTDLAVMVREICKVLSYFEELPTSLEKALAVEKGFGVDVVGGRL